MTDTLRAIGAIAAVAAFVSAPLLLPYSAYLVRLSQ